MKLRKATTADSAVIWSILQDAILQRKNDGSEQWQDGYPNEKSVADDISNGYGYLLEKDGTQLAYAAIIFDKEPAYENIEGQWLTNGDYAVVHRVAAAAAARGRGVAEIFFTMIETLCIENQVFSIKVDTNFDNAPMLRILEKLGYTYCGEVYFRGSARRAFEKMLKN